MKDLKNRYYEITCFTDLNSSGFTIAKPDLKTAFYVFRDCVKSGLYSNVIFRVVSDFGYCQTDAPMIESIKGDFVYMTKNKNWYYSRFLNYIKVGG